MHPNVKALIEREYAAQRSQEWLDLRGKMLTASDAATAIGVNKYQTPHDLLLKKCGIGEKFMGNAATEHGTKLEPVAIEMFEERYNEVVHEAGLIPHPVHKWLGGSPDGITESGSLVEIKCPLMRRIQPGCVPEHYMPQLQLCMEIMDLESCFFVQYQPHEIAFPKPEVFDVTIVPRDREWFKKYLPVMKEFWDKVLYYREHMDELPLPKEKVKRPRKKKEVEPVVCEIEPLPEEDFYNDD
jgi:putative phage-type endonuclease